MCVPQSRRLSGATRPRADLLNFPLSAQINRTVGAPRPGPADSQQVAGWWQIYLKNGFFWFFYFLCFCFQIFAGLTAGLMLSSGRERGQGREGRNARAELSCSWQERLSRTPVVSALTSPCCHGAAARHQPLLDIISETYPGQVNAMAM